ncbi:hypothetical protein MSAN_00548500 [Mycena sanguinolenta]|uniref:Fe2OG dioxygenase domain-containing protein n=1 Tax=Mycena sanguinolenta TaxID=230812 RepID=A0A8H7DFC3_9AGAR|nr:hypothetical protein MSAN_00548500 [Mycena sanguinolenta]
MSPSSDAQEYRDYGLESLRNASQSSLRTKLKIFTDVETPYAEFDTEDSPDSLFDEISPAATSSLPAMLHAPPIPGLFFTPSLLLPVQLADDVTHFCLDNYFNRPGVNQIMLFGVASSSNAGAPLSGLPPVLTTLLSTVSSLLEPTLPPEIHALLFPPNPTRARQAILNLYHPGEGIIPHVDLLRRFGDGIVGVSFGSSCVMEFARVDKAADDAAAPLQLFLPERSIIVLSGDARYAWTHGIEKRTADLVADAGVHRVVQRGVRLSITFRWLLPGADVVGQDD